MSFSVVDTNVLMVAEGLAPQADSRCQHMASAVLTDIRYRRALVLDQGREILGEYQRNLGDHHRQPGVGYWFFAWAARSADIGRWVTIRPHPTRGFAEFPTDPRLEGFDRADRKFVAAAIVSGTADTELVNAVDSDY